jgi:hypothetical protein
MRCACAAEAKASARASKAAAGNARPLALSIIMRLFIA